VFVITRAIYLNCWKACKLSQFYCCKQENSKWGKVGAEKWVDAGPFFNFLKLSLNPWNIVKNSSSAIAGIFKFETNVLNHNPNRPASLLMSFDKARNGIVSTFEWLAGSNRWQLNSKTEKFPLLFPGRGILTNKWVPIPKLKKSTFTDLALFGCRV